MQHRICFVAGKSGGHLIPCITMAHQLKKEVKQITIDFITSNYPLDKTILQNEESATSHLILPIQIKKRWYTLPFFFMKLGWSFAKSVYFLIHHRPGKIITTGGIVALPVCLAGWLLRIPIELFELNAVPGKAIRFLTPFATKTYVCFDDAKQFFPATKTTRTPYPIRFEKILKSERVFKKLQLNEKYKTIFVLGGSQGSVFINETIKKLIERNGLQNANIIHQTGNHLIDDLQTFYNQHNIPTHVFNYEQNLATFYSIADVIICRSGAGTLFESLFFEKPIITIPLEISSTSHQKNNAYAFLKQYPELVRVLRQREIQKNIRLLQDTITDVLEGLC